MSRLSLIESASLESGENQPRFNWRLFYTSGDLGALGAVYATSAEEAMKIVRDEAFKDGVGMPFTVEITRIQAPRTWEIRNVTIPVTREVSGEADVKVAT